MHIQIMYKYLNKIKIIAMKIILQNVTVLK